MALRLIRRLVDLLDVDTTGASVGDRLTLDADGETWVPGAPAAGGGGDAIDVAFSPAGGIAATDVQTAILELDTEKASTASVSAVAAAAVLDGDAAGGVLSGTYPSPGFASDMATQAELDAHVSDSSAAHAASAIAYTPTGSIAATNVQDAIDEAVSEAGGGGAPTGADYLVGTANGGLSAEIVVGTSPGGELGGTWASPTVDATHSGSSHAAVQSAAEATAAAALAAHEADTTGVHGITDTAALVTTARTITAGAALTGGGSLAADQTLDVAVDGSTLEISTDALRVKASGITANEIAANAVGSSELADDAVDTNAIQAGAVTAAKVAADVATQAELDAHTGDTSAAHAASAVSFTPVGSIAATDVQAAIAEVAAEAGSSSPALVDLTDVTGEPPNTGEAPVWDGDSFELTDIATQAELDGAVTDLTTELGTLESETNAAIAAIQYPNYVPAFLFMGA